MQQDNEPNRASLVATGVAWTAFYRVFATLAQFGAMLVLVRILAPAEYGRAGAVVGVLALLNVVSCGAFISQSLQLREGESVDWTSHWRAGWVIQLTLFLTVNALALFLAMFANTIAVAPLLHLASVGLLIECPGNLRMNMLRRKLDFRRLQILMVVSRSISLASTLALAFAGWGAAALVVGANLVPQVPATFDLLVVERFRPDGGWFGWPDWKSYVPAVRFGLQQAWSGALQAGRGALEAFIIPLQFGYTALGLFQRAQAMYSQTTGQISGVFAETVYPLLPRFSNDPSRYRRISTVYLQIVALITIPGAMFIGLKGPSISRLLYGDKWIAADPMLLPGALIGLGIAGFTSAYGVVLAANRLKACFSLDMLAGAVTLPLAGAILLGASLQTYIWCFAGGQLIAAAIALWQAQRHLAADWIRTVLVPPLAGSAVGAVAVAMLPWLAETHQATLQLFTEATLYAVSGALALRLLFPRTLLSVLQRAPGGARLGGWLGLDPEPHNA